MPRTARHVLPGSLVHVRCRFVDRRFQLDSEGRRAYLERLDRVLLESDWALISYALMSSHVHLGCVAGEAKLDSWIHPLNTGVAGWLSARRRVEDPRALGPVFADRPGTNLLPIARAFTLIAYHHNNPVEAGVVTSARHSDWTSHGQYLGSSCRPVAALDVELGLRLSGLSLAEFDTAVERAAKLPQLVEGTPEEAVEVVAVFFGVSPLQMVGGDKTRPIVRARRLALALGARLGHSPSRMGRALNISRTAAARLRSTSDEEVESTACVLHAQWRAGRRKFAS